MDTSKSIRIIFDDLILLRQRSGIAGYAQELLDHFPEFPRGWQLERISQRGYSWPFRMLSKRAGSISSGAPRSGRTRMAAVKDLAQRLVDIYAQTARFSLRGSIFHAPDLFPLPNRSDVTLVTVHDLSVLRCPEWHPPHRVAKYSRQLKRVDERWRYIAISESTKRDLIDFLNVPEERIQVIYEAPRSGFVPIGRTERKAILSKLKITGEYFLYLGTIEPRKNIESLLHAYAKLDARTRARFPLVLVGGWGWKSDEVQRLLECSPWREDVRYLGYVSDTQAVALTSGARALCYPSHFEGFGLPPLEAMRCGTPVISSLAGGLAEAVGEAAYAVEPSDVDSIRGGLAALAEDDALCAELGTRGQARAARFDWNQTAENTLALYRRLL